jgi:hypothetical protein
VVNIPQLWRIKDPLKLINLGQLELPGFDTISLKTVDQLWGGLESAAVKRERSREKKNRIE